MTMYHWVPRHRDYEFERHEASTTSVICNHPLLPKSGALTDQTIIKSNSTTISLENEKRDDFIDPLGAATTNQVDNTKSISIKKDKDDHIQTSSIHGQIDNTLIDESQTYHKVVLSSDFDHFQEWNQVFSKLNDVSDVRQLTMISRFIVEGKMLSNKNTASNTKHIENIQIECEEQHRIIDNLTPEQYLCNIRKHKLLMLDCWKNDKRVESFRIVLDCVTMLGVTHPINFYHIKFVAIIDLLDTFAGLVYKRLIDKANLDRTNAGKLPLSEEFTYNDVFEGTQETAMNWINKVAGVKQLLPRLYLELGLLTCRRFIRGRLTMNDENRISDFRAHLSAHMFEIMTRIRGIANVLIATHLRTYACKIGVDHILSKGNKHFVHTLNRTYVWRALHDTLTAWPYVHIQNQQDCILQLEYLWQCLIYIIQCLRVGSNSEDILPLIEYCKQNDMNTDLLMYPLLQVLPATMINAECLTLAQLILRKHKSKSICKVSKLHIDAILIQQLGIRILQVTHMREAQHRAILQQIWSAIMHFGDAELLKEYIECAQIWVQFTCRYFGINETCALIEDILRYMQSDEIYKKFGAQMLSILQSICMETDAPSQQQNKQENKLKLDSLFKRQPFIVFIDLFSQLPNERAAAAQSIIDTWLKRSQHLKEYDINDSHLASNILVMAATMHDCLGTLVEPTYKVQTASLIIASLAPFTSTRQLSLTQYEKVLDFLVEARSMLPNLDLVTEYICQRMCAHIANVYMVHRMKLSKPITEHLRACVAFVYITVPAISSHLTRLKLYILTSTLSLKIACLPQTDALLRATIQLIPEVPPVIESQDTSEKSIISSEAMIADLISQLLSLLLYAPDMTNPLYMFNGLFNAINRWNWRPQSMYQAMTLLQCLRYLSAAWQTEFAAHIDGVESNDTLYGGSHEYLTAVSTCADAVLLQLVQMMIEMKSAQNNEILVQIACQLGSFIVTSADLEDKNMQALLQSQIAICTKTQAKSHETIKMKNAFSLCLIENKHRLQAIEGIRPDKLNEILHLLSAV